MKVFFTGDSLAPQRGLVAAARWRWQAKGFRL